ncbi:putative xylitol dehydrogenase [Piedraia hortae CBS 480.64]|uniref:D-xylulose reductase n=1 Tax=Piedraia hortae CBS 480.64 TaxID=1314780 RepID=A0A6A7BW39_9PEZI|nr:putative xylitol dehydrogenase [Piedraia hortae CBS 480.64]
MGNQKNPSFLLEKPNHFTYADRPIPHLNNPEHAHSVLIKVQWTGICGSDVHYWVDGAIGDFVVKAPMVLGHESSGTIHSIGSKVTKVKPNDRVAIEPGIPCRRCARCREGRYNLCAEMQFAATPPVDGTLTRFYRVPEDFCYVLPESVSLEEGALMEPLAVGVHIVRQAAVVPGNRVVVFGCGPVGLLAMAVAKAYGATTVVAVDVNEKRVRFAEGYAATCGFVSGREDAPEELAGRIVGDAALGDGADVAIDASGAEACVQAGMHILRAGGTYIQGGMGKPNVVFPIGLLGPKEPTIKGCFRYAAGDYSTAVMLVATGRVKVKELITAKFPFEKAEEAFVETRDAKGIKILIKGPEDEFTLNEH